MDALLLGYDPACPPTSSTSSSNTTPSPRSVGAKQTYVDRRPLQLARAIPEHGPGPVSTLLESAEAQDGRWTPWLRSSSLTPG